ncbi:MAG: serine/threonine-protein phosphatase [Deltaproteobacteria bacterium]|nr:MAG: serine/threonine-protein phosphatase [Deltaproteobacteria bacterium]
MCPHEPSSVRQLQHELESLRQQLAAREQELTDALQSAAHIQRSLIPRRAPTYHNLHFAWRFAPYKKVGGDLFNIAPLDENTIMAYLIDVSGHGIASAMVSVAVHQSLSPTTGRLLKHPLSHRPFYRITSPHEVLAELDAEYPFERFEEFFTISYLLLNPHTGFVRYANAGHPPPLLLHGDGTMERLDRGGPLIGLNHRDKSDEGKVQLQEGDRLFLYTDGLTEQINEQGVPYGEARLVASLHAQVGHDLGHACRNALQDLCGFAGKAAPQDDVTLIGIEFSRREPPGMAT